MSYELVKDYLTARGYGDRAQEFAVSSATVELAAAALGCEGARIAKTLSFKTPEGVVLIVAAGDARVDNHKYKEKFHTKAKMLTPEEAVELVGHAVGGVCPFCVKEGVPGLPGPVPAAVRCDLPRLRQPQQRRSPHPGGAGAALGRRVVRPLQTP